MGKDIYSNKLVKIFKFGFILFVKCLSVFVPVKANRVTLIRTHASGSNVTPLYKELKKNKKLDLELIDHEPYDFSQNLIVREVKLLLKLLRSKVIVTTHGPILTTRKNIVIELWHGTGFKNIGFTDSINSLDPLSLKIRKYNYSNIDLLVSSSKEDKKRKRDSFLCENVRITGSPRNDVFFNSSLLKVDYIKKLDLGKFDKINLYAPTFRDSNFKTPFDENFFEKLNELMSSKNEVFLVKKHPADQDLKIPKKYSNIIDVTTQVEDVQDLLVVTDVLITDYSGIVTDFVLTNRPVIFFMYDYETYTKKSRNFYYDLQEIFPPSIIKSNTQLLNYLEDLSWSKKKNYIKKYEEFKNRFHYYKDGNSTQRVVKLILELKNGK